MSTLSSTLRIGVIDNASPRLKALAAHLSAFRAQNRALMAPLTGNIARIAAFGGAYLGVSQGIRATAGAALGFESAMSDVRKVVEANNAQFATLKRDILGLSTVMPVTAEGFASIYAAAAQSGIATDELKAFSEGVVRMSTAWDTTVETTGESLAKIKTALGRDIAGTMRLGDAINHVSNTSAASARDMLDFTNRVAAFAETAGFSAEQALAFGGAMVGSGFEPEVAATSFRNLTKALTVGTKATKAQRVAMKSLGLDAVKTAKGMQKDAVATTLEVLDKIKKLPEWQQISVASALFGDEARGLAPLFRNADDLRRLLRETGDAANYSGSAFKEYVARASTVGNVLQITNNKIAGVFERMGEDMLPTIKAGAEGIGEVLDTLGSRATPLKQATEAVRGLLDGLGLKGGIKGAITSLGDTILGPAMDEGKLFGKLDRIFIKFREYGKEAREFYDQLRQNPVAQFFGELAGYGFKLFVASAAIGAVAASIRKLAAATALLTGLTSALAILRTFGSIGGLIAGGGGSSVAAAGARGLPGGISAGSAGASAFARWLAGSGVTDLVGSGRRSTQLTAFEQIGRLSGMSGTFMRGLARVAGLPAIAAEVTARALLDTAPRDPSYINPGRAAEADNYYRLFHGRAFEGGMSRAGSGAGPQPGGYSLPQKGASLPDVIKTQPTGVQDVNVKNLIRPNVTNHYAVTVNGVSGDLHAIAGAVVDAIGKANKNALEGSYADGAI